jgi:acetyl-CoA carboxylase biotin carboxyl carrier protein
VANNRGLQDADTKGEVNDIKELTSVVQDLISMMSKGNIDSLQLSFGSLQLSLQSGSNNGTAPAPAGQQESPRPVAVASHPEVADEPDGHIITAPMIGTFYVAPAPNEPPFVMPGDDVDEGQTIGIIEAMKIMNEIAADRSGKIVEILASDGQTVEYGSPLLRIEPSST